MTKDCVTITKSGTIWRDPESVENDLSLLYPSYRTTITVGILDTSRPITQGVESLRNSRLKSPEQAVEFIAYVVKHDSYFKGTTLWRKQSVDTVMNEWSVRNQFLVLKDPYGAGSGEVIAILTVLCPGYVG